MLNDLVKKLKATGFRPDVSMGTPQPVGDDLFLVQCKVELMQLSAEGILTPRAKLLLGSINEKIDLAISSSLLVTGKVFDNSLLKGILENGLGYEFAISQPFPQADDSFVVVGKIETFEYDNNCKPRTLNKVSFNVRNIDPQKAQEAAVASLFETLTFL